MPFLGAATAASASWATGSEEDPIPPGWGRVPPSVDRPAPEKIAEGLAGAAGDDDDDDGEEEVPIDEGLGGLGENRQA